MKNTPRLFILVSIAVLIGVVGAYIYTSPNSKLGPAQDAGVISANLARTNQPRGWIGGDGGASVSLPDGRVLFIWADSFVGTITPAKTYGPFYSFVRNSLTTAKPDGSDITTYVNGAPGKESAYIPNVAARPTNHLWPYSGMVMNNKVILLANEWQPDGKADFGSSFTGNTWVITLSLPSLAIESTTQIIQNDQIQWGTGLSSDDTYSYVYGEQAGKTYLLRTAKGQLTAAPQYSTGRGWSTDRSRAKAISEHNLQSVTQIDGEYCALYMKQPFAKVVYEAQAKSPAGPWRSVSKPVVTIPEASNQKLLQYMPRIHTALTQDGRYVMSYSVNAYAIQDIPSNPQYYQPHYFRGPVK